MMGPDSGRDVSSLWSRSGAATIDFSERNEIGHRKVTISYKKCGKLDANCERKMHQWII
jgi:hypothetical protein